MARLVFGESRVQIAAQQLGDGNLDLGLGLARRQLQGPLEAALRLIEAAHVPQGEAKFEGTLRIVVGDSDSAKMVL